ncbi:phosphate regulon sensor histidine kinase PhoR [Rhodoferax sp.]|uniref:phosphate regulon sensor histidine kinase PhoR n=1 Tax=Rhodoferax sp. TaxID=50421 RepID=UPI0026248109|nr:phosphate regulon sensor histidine kinase PhoR [Rhodoferax sp.]MDD2924800.1 phosphate regulon sensor histidine kinase PhoR [Rhodoferax sp.]
MFGRIVAFLGGQIVGIGLGWVLGSGDERPVTALSGGLLGASLWFLFDALRAAQALRWLRADELKTLPPKSGMWGELLERTQRLLRARDRVIADSDHRLQDFLSALQASPNGVVLLDGQGRIEWCNQTAATHFGLDSSRDLQQTIGNLVRDPGFAAYLASRSFDHELRMPGRDHSPSRPVNLSVQLYPYGGGRLLLLSRDVTAVEQAEAMRRDFVANVSHEIRTPLTVLAGFVETLQTLELSPEERENYLGLMARQSGRMQSLVNDLLTLSKLEGSPAPGLDTWCSATTLMRQLAQDAHALTQVLNGTGQPQHEVSFDILWEGEIAGMANELLSAMGNLVSNAIRYTPPGGRVEVSIRPLADGQVIFEVVDSGPGIAPEHLPRLTERFYRIDRSRSRETGGTGLGLAIVKHVAQRHGATLAIHSVLGQGARFGITFPATRVR